MMNRYHEEDKAMSKDIAKEFGEGWLPPDNRLVIKFPVAFPGDIVICDNYRTPSEPKCIGDVIKVETRWSSGVEYHHVYTIRPASKNYTIRVRNVKLFEAKSLPFNTDLF